MKKSLAVLVLSFSIISPAFSQADVMQYPSYEPPKNGLGSKFLKLLNTPITKDGLIKGAKVASGFVVANKFKFIVGGVALSGVAGYNYLIQHPEKMGDFFSTHPELLDEFTRYVDYRIENAKTQEEYDIFDNVKQKLALDLNENIAQDIKLNNDSQYQLLENDVRNEAIAIDRVLTQNNQLPKCDIFVVSLLITNKKQFENNLNNAYNNGVFIGLPQVQSIPNKTTILDVNTFFRLKKAYQTSDKSLSLEQDHIPSYAAIDKFLLNHGISTKTTYRLNSNNEKETVRDSDLEANETAIATPREIHKLGRTYGGRNYPAKITEDSQNLFEATMKDIATIAYWYSLNPQFNITAQDYIKSAMYIYVRNKMLCLYDVK